MGCSLESSVAEELIVGYAARTLAPDTEIGFERHLGSCLRCRRLAAQQRQVWSALGSWRPVEISSDFDQRLARRIVDEQRLFFRICVFARWIWRPALPVVAVCALLAGVFFMQDSRSAVASAVVPHPPAQIEQQVQHALDDMDMLLQIGVDVSAERPAPPQKI